MKQNILFCLFILFGTYGYSQTNFSNVQLEGQKNKVLTATSEDIYKASKLSSGDTIKSGCDHGSCYINIKYKNKVVSQSIGDAITNLNVYEYDFGNDGDKEIVVINEFSNTAFLFVFAYGQGMIQKIFEKEISYYKTIVKTDYIEYYMPSGLDQVWNYYQGGFWSMNPLELD